MFSIATRWTLALLLLSFGAGVYAGDSCSVPDTTVLTDATGDYSGEGQGIETLPAGAGTPEQDLVSASVGTEGDLLTFKIVLAGAPLAAPLPNASWYMSFNSPDGNIYGVRMDTSSTDTVTFYSYLAQASGVNGTGKTDGRFVTPGSQHPGEAGTGFTGGVVTVVVKAKNVGVFPPLAGQILGPFNAATLQSADAVALSAALTIDTMPDDLTRVGSYNLCGDGKSGPGLLAGSLAPLSLSVLGWFGALMALHRRRH